MWPKEIQLFLLPRMSLLVFCLTWGLGDGRMEASSTVFVEAFLWIQAKEHERHHLFGRNTRNRDGFVVVFSILTTQWSTTIFRCTSLFLLLSSPLCEETNELIETWIETGWRTKLHCGKKDHIDHETGLDCFGFDASIQSSFTHHASHFTAAKFASIKYFRMTVKRWINKDYFERGIKKTCHHKIFQNDHKEMNQQRLIWERH